MADDTTADGEPVGEGPANGGPGDDITGDHITGDQDPGHASHGHGDADPAAGPAGRRSVAATRRSGGTRLTLILGGTSIVLIIAVIVAGFWMNAKATAVPEDGYGPSTASTATVDDAGVVTVSGTGSNGTAPVTIDLYEDALCSECGQLDTQFGQQMAKAIDAGELTVKYHFVDFMNPASTSGDYSTRAYAALLAVARGDGDTPGVFLAFHNALFNPANQPEEVSDGAQSDLDDGQLADLAATVGVSARTQRLIADGTGHARARSDAGTNLDDLNSLWADRGAKQGSIPTAAMNGQLVSISGVDWLTNLLPAGDHTVDGTAGASAGRSASPTG